MTSCFYQKNEKNCFHHFSQNAIAQNSGRIIFENKSFYGGSFGVQRNRLKVIWAESIDLEFRPLVRPGRMCHKRPGRLRRRQESWSDRLFRPVACELLQSDPRKTVNYFGCFIFLSFFPHQTILACACQFVPSEYLASPR